MDLSMDNTADYTVKTGTNAVVVSAQPRMPYDRTFDANVRPLSRFLIQM
jgi:hypothetical protein